MPNQPDLQKQPIVDLITRNERLMLEGFGVMPDSPLNAVVFLGPSGYGKSTFATLLAGRELIARLNTRRLLVLDSPNPIPGITIGHQHTSETSVPHSWKLNDDTICWDCPGFYENRGKTYEIADAILIKKVFAMSTACKIVFFVLGPLLTGEDSRYIGFLKILKDLEQALSQSDIEQIKPGLMLVVSRATQGQTEENIKEQIREIQENDELDLSDSQRKVLGAFVNNPIIIFKKPVEEGVYTCDIENYLRKINQLQFVTPPSLPVDLLMSPESKQNLSGIYNNLSRSINTYIDNFIEHLDTQLNDLITTSVAASDTQQLNIALNGLKSITLKDDNGVALSNHDLLSKAATKCAELEINRAIAPQTLNLINSLNLINIKHKIDVFEFIEQFIGPESRKKLGIQDAIDRYLSNIKNIELQIALLTPKIVTVVQEHHHHHHHGGGGGKCSIL